MQHTKGPWTANRDCRSHLNRGVITEGPMVYGIYTPNSRIAVMQEFRESGFGPQDEEQEANARLIAAAPELLEALNGLLNWGRDHLSPVHNPEAHALLVAAHKAIAKATGTK